MHAPPEELLSLGACEAAARMADGRLPVAAYAEALIGRAAEIGHLGAFTHLDAHGLRRAAAACDAGPRPAPGAQPLFGLPLLFKDNIDVAGLPTTAGSRWLVDAVAPRHAGVTARLLQAGALVLGKANLHEWSQGVTGHNHVFGAARNPHDPRRVAGGSSGGNAVALATRAVAAAIGTDTGGSVRVPAALCGLVGFRPTVGHWPADGLVPISPTFDTAGVMARGVADCALVDAAVRGGAAAVVSHLSAAAPSTPAPLPGLGGQAHGLRGVRLGVPRAYFWAPLEPAVARCCEAALQRLQAAGAELVDCDLSAVGRAFADGAMSISLYEILPALQAYLARHGRVLDARALTDAVVSPDVRPLFERLLDGRAVTPEAYGHALHTLRPQMQAAYRDTFARLRLDALVLPTLPVTAVPIGDDTQLVLDGVPQPVFSTFIRNSGPAGMAGLPSLSLPAGVSDQGLPVGLMLDGPAGSDRALLALGLAVEAVLPPAPVAPRARWCAPFAG